MRVPDAELRCHRHPCASVPAPPSFDPLAGFAGAAASPADHRTGFADRRHNHDRRDDRPAVGDQARRHRQRRMWESHLTAPAPAAGAAVDRFADAP